MDVEKIQRLNNLTKEYKKYDLNFEPSDIVKLEENPDMDESEKVLRRLHFKMKYNEDAIGELKNIIIGLKEEIKELRNQHKEQVQEEFVSQPAAKPETVEPEPVNVPQDNQQKLAEPVDDTKTAPAEVAIDKIFYCGQK